MVNILRRLFGRETRANDGVVSADWLTGKTSMTSISALEAMNIPAVSAAVGFICGIVSTVPIRLYKRIGDDIAEVKGDQRAKLLNDETGDLLDSVQMKEAIVRDYLLRGGGYAYLNKRRK